jgi:hypothetical protein
MYIPRTILIPQFNTSFDTISAEQTEFYSQNVIVAHEHMRY